MKAHWAENAKKLADLEDEISALRQMQKPYEMSVRELLEKVMNPDKDDEEFSLYAYDCSLIRDRKKTWADFETIIKVCYDSESSNAICMSPVRGIANGALHDYVKFELLNTCFDLMLDDYEVFEIVEHFAPDVPEPASNCRYYDSDTSEDTYNQLLNIADEVTVKMQAWMLDVVQRK